MDYISIHDLYEFCTSDYFLLRKLENVLHFI